MLNRFGIFFVLMLLTCVCPIASDGGAKPKIEYYSDRPAIENVEPKRHSELKDWDAQKWAHLEALAEIIEMYPDQEIYFVARDAEYFYDLARILLSEDSATLKQIHLINISRANKGHENVEEYLAENGITIESLKKGSGVVLIDTGFSGTIAGYLRTLFPGAKDKIQAHLIISANYKIPSTRVFLAALNPASIEEHPSKMRGTIISYEWIPRFTDRSDGFVKKNEHWVAVSKDQHSKEGPVSPSLALKYMADLSHFGRSQRARDHFHHRRTQWRSVRQFAVKNNKEALLQTLADMAQAGDPIQVAMVRDFVEISNLNKMMSDEIAIEEVGLIPIVRENSNSNKLEMIKKYPQWITILNNPEKEIANLFDQGDFKTLEELIDVVRDHEIGVIFKLHLKKNSNFQEFGQVLKAMIRMPFYQTILKDLFSESIKAPIETGASQGKGQEISVCVELIKKLSDISLSSLKPEDAR